MNDLRPPMMNREKTPPPYIPKKSPRLKKVSRCYDIKALAKIAKVQEVVMKVPKVIEHYDKVKVTKQMEY